MYCVVVNAYGSRTKSAALNFLYIIKNYYIKIFNVYNSKLSFNKLYYNIFPEADFVRDPVRFTVSSSFVSGSLVKAASSRRTPRRKRGTRRYFFSIFSAVFAHC